MKLLGVDYGDKYIGVAFTEGSFPRGLITLRRSQALTEIKQICLNLKPSKIILGLPSGHLLKKVNLFKNQLEEITNLSIELWDETLTTHEAQIRLRQTQIKTKERPDRQHQTAAVLILESYLETTK